jgi:hypothetical protein
MTEQCRSTFFTTEEPLMNFRTPDLSPALSLCLLLLAPIVATADTNTPNVILCMTDDQGWGDTSYNGHP